MPISLEKVLRTYPRPYLTDAELKSLIDGSADSRYGKVKRRVNYCISEEAYISLQRKLVI